MIDGKIRKLVFENLLAGHNVERVRQELKLSEKEVLDAWDFVARKIRSYRFERGMPLLPCQTVAEAQQNRLMLLHTLQRVNAGNEPRFSRIETVPIDGEPVAGGTMGRAEAIMFELRAKGAANGRRR